MYSKLILCLILTYSVAQIIKPPYDSSKNNMDGVIETQSEDPGKDEIISIQVPNYYVTNVMKYAFSFWVRFYQEYPVHQSIQAWSYPIGIAGVTESYSGAWCKSASDWGDKNFAMTLKPYSACQTVIQCIQGMGYHKGYAVNWNWIDYWNLQAYQEQNQGLWYFFYGSYSMNSFIHWYHMFPGGAIYDTASNVYHNNPPTRLIFSIGGQVGCLNAPAQYFNVQFHYNQGLNFMFNDQTSITNYRNSGQVQQPSNFMKASYEPKKVYTVIGETAKTYTDKTTFIRTEAFQILDQPMISEFAIQGWARFTGAEMNQQNLFNIYNRDPTAINFFVYKLHRLHRFSTNGFTQVLFWNKQSRYGYGQANDYWGDTSTFTVTKEKYQNWFWFYTGFQYETLSTYYFFKFFSDSPIQGRITTYMSPVPQLFVHIGASYELNPWSGDVKHVYFRVGQGAYKTQGFDESFQLVKDMFCTILYSECEYFGDTMEVCGTQNTLDPTFSVQSIKLPPNMKVTLYNQEALKGQQIVYTTSQPCLDSVEFKMMIQTDQHLIYN